jgi:hypothetical protein
MGVVRLSIGGIFSMPAMYIVNIPNTNTIFHYHMLIFRDGTFRVTCTLPGIKLEHMSINVSC